MKSIIFGVILIAVLTIVSGMVQGRMSNRWGPSEIMYTAAKQLEKLPAIRQLAVAVVARNERRT